MSPLEMFWRDWRANKTWRIITRLTQMASFLVHWVQYLKLAHTSLRNVVQLHFLENAAIMATIMSLHLCFISTADTDHRQQSEKMRAHIIFLVAGHLAALASTFPLPDRELTWRAHSGVVANPSRYPKPLLQELSTAGL